MKFLIDESVEKPIVDWLRDQKYDVMYVAESSLRKIYQNK